ncbi:SMI1/KNR4 family protein [Sphingosinicella terrae]|uniref:SMI1/KNR4 family protein n=1 Tax=Sphingosinicella terrae TaxID=2172047 RepID=UPI000E0D98E8|nr:SMI1/KNR4 family protein [Sphingosinicella terrae]
MPRPDSAPTSAGGADNQLATWIGAPPDPDAVSKVAALEARLKLVLPDDFRAYLIETAPRSNADDACEICWWSLDAIRSVPEELGYRAQATKMERALGGEPEKHVFFADYMGWAYAWAICCSDGPDRGRIGLICTGFEGFVADSFSEFATLAMANSPTIHLREDREEAVAAPEAWLRAPGKRKVGILEFLLYLPLLAIVSGGAALLAIWAANNLR